MRRNKKKRKKERRARCCINEEKLSVWCDELSDVLMCVERMYAEFHLCSACVLMKSKLFFFSSSSSFIQFLFHISIMLMVEHMKIRKKRSNDKVGNRPIDHIQLSMKMKFFFLFSHISMPLRHKKNKNRESILYFFRSRLQYTPFSCSLRSTM